MDRLQPVVTLFKLRIPLRPRRSADSRSLGPGGVSGLGPGSDECCDTSDEEAATASMAGGSILRGGVEKEVAIPPPPALPPRYRFRDLILGDYAFNDDGERCCILLQRNKICCMSLRNAQLVVCVLNILFSFLVAVNVWLTMKSHQFHVGTESLLHVLIVLFAVNGICAFISWFSRTIGVAIISLILTLILEAVILTTIALLINILVIDKSIYNQIAVMCGFCYGGVGLFTYVAVHCYFRELFEEEVYRNNMGLNA